MIRKILSNAVVGIGVSFIVTLIMLNIFARNSAGSEILDAASCWLVAGIFYGIIAMIFNTRLSRLLQFIIHFICTLGVTIITIKVMFEYAFRVTPDFSYLSVFAIFVGIYSIICLSFYLYNRVEIEQINQILEAKNE